MAQTILQAKLTKAITDCSLAAPWNLLDKKIPGDPKYDYPVRTNTMKIVTLYNPLVKAASLFSTSCPSVFEYPFHLVLWNKAAECTLEAFLPDETSLIVMASKDKLRLNIVETDGTRSPIGKFSDMSDYALTMIALSLLRYIFEYDKEHGNGMIIEAAEDIAAGLNSCDPSDWISKAVVLKYWICSPSLETDFPMREMPIMRRITFPSNARVLLYQYQQPAGINSSGALVRRLRTQQPAAAAQSPFCSRRTTGHSCCPRTGTKSTRPRVRLIMPRCRGSPLPCWWTSSTNGLRILPKMEADQRQLVSFGQKEIITMSKRKPSRYWKTLHQQASDELVSMQAFGESKHLAKLDGSYLDKIFSKGTFEKYKCCCNRYCSYVKVTHPNCSSLRKARRYIAEYLRHLESMLLSAWTIHTAAKALNKLYHIRPGDKDYYKPPARYRKNIVRSRKPNGFNEQRHEDLVLLCHGTGLRHCEIPRSYSEHLCSREYIASEISRVSSIPMHKRTKKQRLYLIALKDTKYFPDVKYFIFVPRGKGGRMRFAPIIGPHVNRIVEMYRHCEPGKRVFPKIPSHAPTHRYRAEYAATLYLHYARPIAEIPYDRIHRGLGHAYQAQVYHCRADMQGIRLDKHAMLLAAKGLGHNRISVFAYSYAWPLVHAMQQNPDNKALLPYIS